MAILELSVLLCGAPPSFSHIPLSQCKRRALCRRERLHVTPFGKMAVIPPERALNCTYIPYVVYGAILGLVKSHGVSSIPLSSSVGFVRVKNTDCLPL